MNPKFHGHFFEEEFIREKKAAGNLINRFCSSLTKRFKLERFLIY